MSVLRFGPLLALALVACGPTPEDRAVEAQQQASGVAPGPSVARQAIETATFVAPPAPAPAPAADGTAPAAKPPVAPQPALIRAQILLDRARFSPGVVDGLGGENTRQAIAAFEKAAGLTEDGELDAEVFNRLTGADSRPVTADYVIAAADVAGPFLTTPTDDLEALSKLQSVGYTSPLEGLAEKFHMTEGLLTALNPGVDFSKAGSRIVVANVAEDELPADVARITVDKTEKSVRAFDADGKLLAFYPATIGSSDMPAPSGRLTVNGVARAPTYTYDPARLNYGDGKSKVIVPAGPNNPVGAVWIDLSRDTYGIHGAPDPSTIAKAASHGCVRLTNWDAQQLAAKVKPGVVVVFS